MAFFKLHIEKKIWITEPLSMIGERQGVRLFDLQNNLLATFIIQEGMGMASTESNGNISKAEVF